MAKMDTIGKIPEIVQKNIKAKNRETREAIV